MLSGSAESTLPAMNCPKPGGNVSVETSKVTSAGYSRRLREAERKNKKIGRVKTENLLKIRKAKQKINIGHNEIDLLANDHYPAV